MRALVSIYTESKRTVTIGEDGGRLFLNKKTKDAYKGQTRKETTLEHKTLYKTAIEIKGTLPMGKKLAKVEHFATQVIGARIAALMEAGKKFPGKVFFRIDLGGKVYSSQTVLAKADLMTTISVTMKQVAGKTDKEVIALVAGQQKKGIRAAVSFLRNVEEAAKSAEAYTESNADLSFLAVAEGGEVVEVVDPVPAAEGETVS